MQGHRSKNEIIHSLQFTVIQFLFNAYSDSDVHLNQSHNFNVAKKHLDIDDRFVAAILSNKSSQVD